MTITFSILLISRASYFFFQKYLWDLQILQFELVFSFVIGWKIEFFTNSDFVIRKNLKK